MRAPTRFGERLCKQLKNESDPTPVLIYILPGRRESSRKGAQDGLGTAAGRPSASASRTPPKDTVPIQNPSSWRPFNQ